MTPKTFLMTLAAAGVATSLFYKARASRPAAVMPRLKEESSAPADTAAAAGSAGEPASWPFPAEAAADPSASDRAADEAPIHPGLPDVSRGA